VLGTLRFNTDTFGDLRLEIRQDTFDGDLRYSVGPEDATRVRVLIRDEAGQYQVRDGEDQAIHEADDFFEAVLQATQENGQNALGYKPGDAEQFREWVMAKSAPPSERRTVLAEPPIRPVAEHETMLLVRGGWLSKEGLTLHERIQDLYPHFSEAEVDNFASALTAQGEPMPFLEEQENALNELNSIIHRWNNAHYDMESDTHAPLNGVRGHIADRLRACFNRENTKFGSRTDPHGYALDLSHDELLLPMNLGSEWPERPLFRTFLDKVTVLKLDNTRFSGKANGLLKDFPNLRELSASGCELTSLPENIGSMQRLERLRLSDNEIVLDAAAVEQLKHLDHLEILRLMKTPWQGCRHFQHAPAESRRPAGHGHDHLARRDVEQNQAPGFSAGPSGQSNQPDSRSGPRLTAGLGRGAHPARCRQPVGINQVRYQAIRRSVALPPEPIVPANSQADWVVNSNYSADTGTMSRAGASTGPISGRQLVDEPQAERFLNVLLDTRSRDFEKPARPGINWCNASGACSMPSTSTRPCARSCSPWLSRRWIAPTPVRSCSITWALMYSPTRPTRIPPTRRSWSRSW
jgi:hypothetical protein